jgi:hypothetical protein
MDIDIDAFYSEQDKRMNLPDEDFDEYLERIGARARCVFLTSAQLFIPTRTLRKGVVDPTVVLNPGHPSQDTNEDTENSPARGLLSSANIDGLR